jgi:hypothetical protein
MIDPNSRGMLEYQCEFHLHDFYIYKFTEVWEASCKNDNVKV